MNVDRGSGYLEDTKSNEPHIIAMDVKITKVAAGLSHSGANWVLV